MPRTIYINLPVSDLAASRRFYTGLGFTVNEDYSDGHCAGVAISDTIVVMLLDHDRFRDFITTDISDARRSTEVINCLSAENRAEVDDLLARALEHGGTRLQGSEGGGMYGVSFADPDGHIWEVLHMDLAPQR